MTRRPDTLPQGRPWPPILVLVAPGEGDAAATARSVADQAYPEGHCARLGDAEAASRFDATDAGYVMIVQAGDRLAPGALTALCCEAVLTGADIVAGLRVLYDDDGVIGLDMIGAPAGALDRDTRDDAPCDLGGTLLVSLSALARSGVRLGASDGRVTRIGWQMAETGASVSRVGRPVLLREDRSARGRRQAGRPLSVAMLTDLGYRGGAGIAHRRLSEALALGGHTVTHLRLDAESAPAAAEWTSTFPRAEAAAALHDLVIVGNIHGATRSTSVLARLSVRGPVAVILHDLFALTGRCAHPKSCPLIETGCNAACPSPDEYPQLAPRRIADAHAEKRAVLAGTQAPLLLTTSAWATDRARAWAPQDARIDPIRLAFPTGVFRPRARAAVRRDLGLPPDDRLVVFGAVIADALDKGFRDLIEALRHVAGPGIGFVALGRLDDPGALGLPNLHVPGPIGDEERLAAYYASCDVYITASRLETFGQTPIEAGLCGVPTVAYRATGLTSSVIDGVTGVSVDPNAGTLGPALAALLDDAPRRDRLGATARIVFENRFSHAASALSLDNALVRHGIRPAARADPRMTFVPAMLGHFAFAAQPHPGATGTVASASRPNVRRLRRLKHALIGRGMPLWLRYLTYAVAILRRIPARGGPPRADPSS